MQKLLVASLSLILVYFPIYGQSKKSYSAQEIIEAYDDLFTISIDYEEEKKKFDIDYIFQSLPKSHFLHDMLNEYQGVIDYLWLNNSNVMGNRENWLVFLEELKPFYEDSIAAHTFAINYLKKDETFNYYFLSFVKYYLQNEGILVTNFKSIPKAKITKAQLLEIGSRFFYASHLNEKNRVQVYTCMGTNGHKDLNYSFDPSLILAFCVRVITRSEYLGKDTDPIVSQAMKDVYQEIDELGNLEGEEKVTFFRKSLYDKMQNDLTLASLLIEQYTIEGKAFGFELID